MSMSKKDFIALADIIRQHNEYVGEGDSAFNREHLAVLASFCRQQNYNFMRERWLDYIAGKCGKNGGAVKKAKGKVAA